MVLVALLVLGAGATATAQPEARSEDPVAAPRVMASLNQALAWYRRARIVMHSLDSVGVFARADEQAVLRLIA